jgi:hypothetical protein
MQHGLFGSDDLALYMTGQNELPDTHLPFDPSVLAYNEGSFGMHFAVENAVYAHRALEIQLALIHGSGTEKGIDFISGHWSLLICDRRIQTKFNYPPARVS